MDQIRFTSSRRSCVYVILARVFVTVTRQGQLQTGPFHSAVDQQQGEDLLTSGNFNFSKSISSASSGSINFFKFLSCISLFCLVQPDCVQLTCPSFLSIRSLIVSILNIPSLQPHLPLILYTNTTWPYLKTNNTKKKQVTLRQDKRTTAAATTTITLITPKRNSSTLFSPRICFFPPSSTPTLFGFSQAWSLLCSPSLGFRAERV
jgi:hypothetical protein